MSRTITVKELVKAMDLEIYAGENGINNIIAYEEVRFPWLEFAGIFDYYEAKKINLVSSKEAVYLDTLGVDLANERVEEFFKRQPSGIIFSKNVDIPEFIIELGNKYNKNLPISNVWVCMLCVWTHVFSSRSGCF